MNIKTGEGRIINKSYAASALDDAQQSIKSLTLRAAQAQGLSKNTHVTALCDGAKNCWTVVDFIQPEAGSMIKILDWFHISMKFKNLAVSTDPALKIKKIKWHLWRGFPERALYRLKEVSEMTKSSKEKIKLQKLITYLENNKDYIVDYRMRRKEGLVFTSQLAESTVESLINQRCKSKQHMSWTRKGLHALLQLKSSLASNDWGGRWQRYIMLALISSKEKQRNM